MQRMYVLIRNAMLYVDMAATMISNANKMNNMTLANEFPANYMRMIKTSLGKKIRKELRSCNFNLPPFY